GFAGQGAGRLTVSADGKLILPKDCNLRLAADDLKTIGELVRKAKPQEWKPSYVQPMNPSGCCDMIKTTVTLRRGALKWTSTWYKDHDPLPPDLDAIMTAVGGSDPTSIRTHSEPQCKP